MSKERFRVLDLNAQGPNFLIGFSLLNLPLLIRRALQYGARTELIVAKPEFEHLTQLSLSRILTFPITAPAASITARSAFLRNLKDSFSSNSIDIAILNESTVSPKTDEVAFNDLKRGLSHVLKPGALFIMSHHDARQLPESGDMPSDFQCVTKEAFSYLCDKNYKIVEVKGSPDAMLRYPTTNQIQKQLHYLAQPISILDNIHIGQMIPGITVWRRV